MPIAKEITLKMPQVYQLLEQFDVSDAWLFGSGRSDNFSKESDVDIMVQFKEKITPLRLGMNMNELSFSLQKLFEREVDLISYSHIKNPAFFSQVSENSTRIYGEENPRLYVQHMMNCIVKIQTFTGPVKSFHAYKKDFLIQAGVEWNLTILGEAAKRLKNISPDIAIALSNPGTTSALYLSAMLSGNVSPRPNVFDPFIPQHFTWPPETEIACPATFSKRPHPVRAPSEKALAPFTLECALEAYILLFSPWKV
jgi:predicted nucleotidyltransferase